MGTSEDVTGKPVCIVVMGMHRSGTSALSGVLGLLGNGLPRSLIGGDANNPKGYYESDPLNSFNSEIMSALDSTWDDWHSLEHSRNRLQNAGLVQRGRAILAEEVGGASQIVFKDPRNSRVLDFWLPLLDELGYRTVAINTVRNPWEVAASLAKRVVMPLEKGLLLWLRNSLDAERLTRGLPRFHTSYDLLMQDWRGVVDAASHDLGLTWRRGAAEAADEINGFLSHSLRHFDHPSAQGDAALDWRMVREAQNIFIGWSRHGETTEGRSRLDEITAQFDQCEPVLQDMVDAAVARELTLQETATDARRWKDRTERAEVGWQAATDQLAELKSQLSGVDPGDAGQSNDANPILANRLDRAQSALTQSTDEVARLSAELASLRQTRREADLASDVLREEAAREVLRLKAVLAHELAGRGPGSKWQPKTGEADLSDAEEDRIANQKQAIEHLASRIRTLDAQLKTTTGERNKWQAEVKSLRASTSWRITGPMRRLIRLGKRLTKRR